jgi:hypothetical protein
MQELWQKEAEQMGGPELARVLTEMRDAQRQLIIVVEGLKQRDIEDRAVIDKLITGFPAGDTESHRRYHEAVIEWRELRNKLVREALIKVTQAGALAAFGWLALAIWQSFKLTVKQ